jgi:hypothetical protein
MTKRSIIRHIVLYEIIGFGPVILFLWLDEILDLPHHLLGAPATPINWAESALESVLAFFLVGMVILLTRRFLRHIKYLEGFLLFCAGCKRVRYHAQWIPVDVFVRDHSEADITHGLCPDCLDQYAGGWGAPPYREMRSLNGKKAEPDSDILHFAPCACGAHDGHMPAGFSPN